MKKVAIILISALLALAFPEKVLAQEPEAGAFEQIEGVVVTASRLPEFLGQSARMVTVLDSLAISSIPATTLTDLLKFAAGVDVRQRGPEGMQADVSLRGGTCEQVAILLDGVNIGDPQTGHNSADFPVPVSEIERIEILEGPAARTYGTSSLLGAINIVTRKPGHNGVEARLEGGSYGLFSASASVREFRGRVRNALSASYARSDGYTRSRAGNLNMDFRSVKAFYHGQTDLRNFRLDWHAGASVKDFGSATFYSPRFDEQFEHTAKTILSLRGESSGKLHLRPGIYWNHGEDRFELFRSRPDLYPFNHHRTNVLGAKLDAWVETPLGRTVFGAELRNEDIVSTNLGEPLDRESGSAGRTRITRWG